MSYRRLIFLALLGGLPTMVWGQFTTFIPPQPPRAKVTDSAKTVVIRHETVRTDTIMRMRLTDMRAWVDSAAGSVAPPSTAPKPPESVPTIPASLAHDTASISFVARDSAVRVRHGTRAPATASELPLLAAIGAAALAVGTVLLAGTQLGRERA
jgi:hypothetical protein